MLIQNLHARHLKLFSALVLLPVFYSLLQGCAAPLVVAGAAGGAVVASDERSPSTMLDDQLYEGKIATKIGKDPELKDQVHVNITSFNGIVLLTGEALSRSARSRIEELAYSDPRARRVYNEIRVADITDLKSRSNDTLMTTKIKSRLAQDDDVKSNRVKVVTEFGTVYLMGIVSREMGDRAAQIASNVTGVKRVVKLFEYI
jgi:osmotically-inducible protein OsmY